jgi:HlyD family secretion protein
MSVDLAMKLTTIAFFVFGLVVGGGGVYFLKVRGDIAPAPESAPRAARPPRAASALGRVQPDGGVISLGVSLPDQLARLLVQEGQDVKEGDVLAELASRDDHQLELDLLDSQINEAEHKLKEIDQTGALQLAMNKLEAKQIEEQGPIDISMQKLKVDLLKKQAAQARENLDRIMPLPSVSKQEKDQQEMVVLKSQAELAGAEDLFRKLTLGHALNLQLAEAKMNLARATQERTRNEVPLASLKKQRAMAAHRVDQTFLKAPSKGKILKILARPGELVGAPQPILQMADLSRMAVLAEVYETDIHKVHEGQRVSIASKVESARKLTGRVVALGAMIGKNRVYDADPLADVDRRVIEVKILLDEPALAAGLINLQVNVDFLPP